MSPTALRIDPKLKARIKKLAEKAGESPHSFMLKALEATVERAETREEWLESGRRAAEEFDRTRMGLELEDLDDWFTRSARGEKVEMPKARRIPKARK